MSRGLVGAAFEGARNLFSPNKIDSLQSGCQMPQPTSSSSDSYHLGAAQYANSSDSQHLVQHNLQIVPIPTTRVHHLPQTVPNPTTRVWHQIQNKFKSSTN